MDIKWNKIYIINGQKNQTVSAKSNMKIAGLKSVIKGRISVSERITGVAGGGRVWLKALTLQ